MNLTARNKKYIALTTRYGMDGPGIESRWGVSFSAPWGPYSLLYSGNRVSFPEVKRSGRENHHPHPAPRLKKELNYIATPLLDHPPQLAPRLKKELTCISTPPMGHPPHQAPRLKEELSYISTPLWTTHAI